MNKTYKVAFPKDEEVLDAKIEIRNNTVYVNIEVKNKWCLQNGEIYYAKYIYGHIIIFDRIESDSIKSYVDLDIDDNYLSVNTCLCEINDASIVHPATDSEKQLLFDALAKEGKMWDAEKKAVVDLPKPRVEVKEHSTSSEKDIDWEERRYEIARQMLPVTSNFTELMYDGVSQRRISREDATQYAIKYADTLIAELKKGGEK